MVGAEATADHGDRSQGLDVDGGLCGARAHGADAPPVLPAGSCRDAVGNLAAAHRRARNRGRSLDRGRPARCRDPGHRGRHRAGPAGHFRGTSSAGAGARRGDPASRDPLRPLRATGPIAVQGVRTRRNRRWRTGCLFSHPRKAAMDIGCPMADAADHDQKKRPLTTRAIRRCRRMG